MSDIQPNLMMGIKQIPFFRLCKIIYQNGGLSSRGLVHVLPWLLKTTCLEPLRWVESARYGKKIRNFKFSHSPVFVLGYYRSGTTYLQRMFMQDRTFGFTSIFQTVLPEIMLAFEKQLTPILDSASKMCRHHNHFHRIPFQWGNFPGEEDVALTAFVKQQGSQWGFLFPKQSADYLDRDVLLKGLSEAETKQWKENYLYLLKKISIANEGKQLVLKNPPNTARIKLILELFPESKFIHIIRNPIEVFASNRRFWQIILKHYALGRCHKIDTDELILTSYFKIMSQYLEAREMIKVENLCEVRYEDFILKPVDSMQHIYYHLNLGVFNNCKIEMMEFVNQQKKYSLIQHHLAKETELKVERKLERFIEFWKKGNNSSWARS